MIYHLIQISYSSPNFQSELLLPLNRVKLTLFESIHILEYLFSLSAEKDKKLKGIYHAYTAVVSWAKFTFIVFKSNSEGKFVHTICLGVTYFQIHVFPATLNLSKS